MNPPRNSVRIATLALLGLTLAACSADPDVVIYCALDQVHAEPLIQRFEEETGLTVRAEFDVEANKTVGLVNRLRAESAATRCDVFWNNEIANTVALGAEGLLAPYDSPAAADIPAVFRDAGHLWTGFAARGRVFIVNTDLMDPAELTGMWDLFDERWAGKAGMARPLTGTTLTHMTALYSVLGEAEARRYVETAKRLNEEGKLDLTSGNATLMRLVRDGKLAFGWTDTDDYNVARLEGAPVAAVYPDQDGIGTMVIPNSVAMLKGAPHAENAKRLIDYILSESVERELAFARSAQIPVRASVERPDYVRGADQMKVMEVDFRTVGAELPARHEELKELFVD
ncbi:MAG: extracellular solute-binding protein [Planctomycetota bacterium]|nr:extracellular solute-binding protein [Planctomycetota bacterium]